MEKIEAILHFLKALLLQSFGQLISVFGVFFFFGLLLYFLARFTRTTFVKSIGQKFDIYFTGWIGTPIHELGHAMFCIPFGHRIVAIKLFSPNAVDGSLGYVNHAYKPGNIWHQIGNFFIGFGPIFFGSFVLFLLIKYLVPDNHDLLIILQSNTIDLSTWQGVQQQFVLLYKSGSIVFFGLFTSINMHSWKFWLFLYLALCIASHMELSPADLKGLGSGFLTIVILLLVVNSILLLFNIDGSDSIRLLSAYSNISVGIFTFATLLSFLFFVCAYLLLNIYTLIRYRNFFHPF